MIAFIGSKHMYFVYIYIYILCAGWKLHFGVLMLSNLMNMVIQVTVIFFKIANEE